MCWPASSVRFVDDPSIPLPNGGNVSATANAARLPGVGSKPSGLKTRRPVLGAVGALVTLVILELASITGVLPASALPPASKVIVDVFGLLVDLAFLQDVGATLVAWFIGLSIASVFGIALGLVLGSFRLLFEATGAVIEFLRPIPSVALLPLAALVYGQGAEMKVVLVIYAALWPVLFNTLYAVRGLEPVARETASSFRLGSVEGIRRVLLPHSAPGAFTGIRISASIALIVAISAEMLAGSPSGIGSYVLRVSLGGGETSLVLAGTAIAGLLGVFVNLVLRAVESTLFKWRKVAIG